MRTHFISLCAVLALTAAATAQDVPTLIPAQPIAPTRGEQMSASALGIDGVPVGFGGASSASCSPTEAARRRLLPDGSRLRALCNGIDRFRDGVATPFGCSCYAAEVNFMFGGCKAFFRPAWDCTSCGPFGCGKFYPIEYGQGFRGVGPAGCK